MDAHTKMYLKRAFLSEKFFYSIDWKNEHKQHLCWSSVILFYATVHYFNAFICEKLGRAEIPASHTTHNKKIGNQSVEIEGRTPKAMRILNINLPVSGIYSAGAAYQDLYHSSQSSRYDIGASDLFTEKDLENAEKNFNKVRAVVQYELACRPCDNPTKGATNTVCFPTVNRKTVEVEILAM